jgi:hypothetical protein
MPAIPLKPDPSLLKFSERRSFARAVAAMALGGDARKGPEEFLKRNWRHDSDAERVLKSGSVA